MADGIKVELIGGPAFTASCRKAAADLARFNAASRSASDELAKSARLRAPRRTGRLAASIRAQTDPPDFTVTVTLGAVYPAVQEYGSARRGIRARHYMQQTGKQAEGVVERDYGKELEKIADSIKGA